jgi:putative transposase
MSCAKSVLPVFMTKPSPRDRREEPPDIQIRPSNELSESFMHQWIPRKCHSPNRTVVVADITYVPTWAGFLYLAVVLDACSRRIVGWSMATTLATQLVLGALNMALAVRRPRGVIHHSDQGSQGGFK